MSKRNATAAVIGAGDFIGSAIAKKFAAEGFAIFAGRRNAEKLAPLVADVEASGGEIVARALDARKEDDITGFLRDADTHAPLEVCIFNVGGNVNFPLLETTERVFRKVWELGCYAGFLTGREAARLMLRHGKGCISSPAPPQACAAASAIRPSPAPSTACAPSPRAWRANSAPRTFMSRI